MLDGYMFAVGGYGGERSEDSMERYDPRTDTWELMESVGVKEHYNYFCCDVVALNGHLYFIGMEQICILTHLLRPWRHAVFLQQIFLTTMTLWRLLYYVI